MIDAQQLRTALLKADADAQRRSRSALEAYMTSADLALEVEGDLDGVQLRWIPDRIRPGADIKQLTRLNCQVAALVCAARESDRMLTRTLRRVQNDHAYELATEYADINQESVGVRTALWEQMSGDSIAKSLQLTALYDAADRPEKSLASLNLAIAMTRHNVPFYRHPEVMKPIEQFIARITEQYRTDGNADGLLRMSVLHHAVAQNRVARGVIKEAQKLGASVESVAIAYDAIGDKHEAANTLFTASDDVDSETKCQRLIAAARALHSIRRGESDMDNKMAKSALLDAEALGAALPVLARVCDDLKFYGLAASYWERSADEAALASDRKNLVTTGLRSAILSSFRDFDYRTTKRLVEKAIDFGDEPVTPLALKVGSSTTLAMKRVVRDAIDYLRKQVEAMNGDAHAALKTRQADSLERLVPTRRVTESRFDFDDDLEVRAYPAIIDIHSPLL